MKTARAQGPGPGSAPAPTGRGPRWSQDAEKTFGMGRGLAPKLMTEEEWKEHQAKMRTMTPAERQKYREETHAKMVERAKEKGISMPPGPMPQGPKGGWRFTALSRGCLLRRRRGVEAVGRGSELFGRERSQAGRPWRCAIDVGAPSRPEL